MLCGVRSVVNLFLTFTKSEELDLPDYDAMESGRNQAVFSAACIKLLSLLVYSFILYRKIVFYAEISIDSYCANE
jgi:hypothetical protein